MQLQSRCQFCSLNNHKCNVCIKYRRRNDKMSHSARSGWFLCSEVVVTTICQMGKWCDPVYAKQDHIWTLGNTKKKKKRVNPKKEGMWFGSDSPTVWTQSIRWECGWTLKEYRSTAVFVESTNTAVLLQRPINLNWQHLPPTLHFPSDSKKKNKQSKGDVDASRTNISLDWSCFSSF